MAEQDVPWGPYNGEDFHIFGLSEYSKNITVSSDRGSTMDVLVTAKDLNEKEERQTLGRGGNIEFHAGISRWKEFSIKGIGAQNQRAFGEYSYW